MTVEQAAQRFPGEVILPDDFEVTVDLDGDGTMDTVYLSYVSSMPPGACGISEADCEYNQRDVGDLSLMILEASIGSTPAVLVGAVRLVWRWLPCRMVRAVFTVMKTSCVGI